MTTPNDGSQLNPAHAPTPPASQRMARFTDAELIEHAEEVIDVAGRKLSALCHGERWRMSVPVNDDDSDIPLGRVIALARLLLRERRRSTLSGEETPERIAFNAAREGYLRGLDSTHRDDGFEMAMACAEAFAREYCDARWPVRPTTTEGGMTNLAGGQQA